MPRYAGFVGPAYRSRSAFVAADELVNMYVEKVESGTGKAPYVLYSAPGFDSTAWVTLTGTIRGMATINGRVYVVNGSHLDYVANRNSVANRGTVSGGTGSSLVSIAGSTYVGGDIYILVAASGTLNYFRIASNGSLSASGVVADIAADYVVYLDGTFYALDTTTSSLYASAPGDGSTWDPADVVQRSDMADNWSAMLVYRGELYLIGSQTGSVYYDAGSEVFPLAPNPSGKLTFGTPSGRTAAVVNGVPVWLAQDGTGNRFVVKVGGGYNPVRISTHALEYELSTYTTVADADAFAFQEQGHWFYVLSFPTAGRTWCYDDATGMWFRYSPGVQRDLSDLAVCPARTYAYDYTNQVHLVGSRSNAKVWDIGSSFYTNPDGTGMLRLRRAPHLSNENNRIAYSMFTLDMAVGVNATIALRFSNNSGNTWSTARTVTITSSDYLARVDWGQLGAARDRIFEVSCSDAVAISFIDAYLEYRPGRT